MNILHQKLLTLLKSTHIRWKLLSFFSGAVLLILLAASVAKKTDKPAFEAARELIVMRKIAHRILQYTGDSISVVQPASQLAYNEFLIPFKTSFSFQPDSLVRIIDGVITAHHLPPDYIVNVTECSSGKVFFGYAILSSEQTDIIPCSGREQPVLQYCVNIKFREKKSNGLWFVAIAGICLLLTGSLAWAIPFYKKKKETAASPAETNDIAEGVAAVSIGNYLFYQDQLLLVYDDEKTVLTMKESKLLGIFAEHPNQVIERNKLQKEVWEDEGVIVGRSLDVFISRLRKKLEKDKAIQLVTVHGRGYKLEIKEPPFKVSAL